MSNHFFNSTLQSASSRIAITQPSARLRLDKNEQSEDLDNAFKKIVLDSLSQENWNRYPSADLSDIEAKVAAYCNLAPENIALSAGSANIITTLLNYFALNHKKINIVQPSYSLFDYHCKTYNIPYQPWLLNNDLEYDFDNIPQLDAESVLIITSPNNPVGNTISTDQLTYLLEKHPDSLIIIDGVYCEFSNTDFTPLVQKYDNLMVIRSFSKAFPIAGLRLGYLCAAPKIVALVKKLILPFSINPLTLVFAREVLFHPEFIENAQKRVQEIIQEREKLYNLIQHSFSSNLLHVYKSEGNFLLIRVVETETFENLISQFSKQGIKVLNTSNTPLLHNTFRVSIGTKQENEIFFECLLQNINPIQRLPITSRFTPKLNRKALYLKKPIFNIA